ncbi:MAG TPA: TetR family transcriptional regulator [Caulobacteraceae bacterium]|nr:TetR family transcriptional regulator [Caulobacteraceae bacterium]
MADVVLEREEMELRRYGAELPALPLKVEPLAAALREWLEQRARWSRRQSRAVCELVLMSYRDPAASGFNRRYLETLCAFLTRLCPSLTAGAAQTLALFLIAEAPNWLVLADETMFKMLSAETAQRAVALVLGAQEAPSAFWLSCSRARAETELASPAEPVAEGSKRRILEAVVNMIEEDGPQGITHRAISARAKVSLSSLMHHFGRRSDLLRAGVQELYQNKLSQRQAASWRTAAAPYELALYALQDPFLAPIAAAVRRKLGADMAADIEDGARQGRDELAALLQCAIALMGETAADLAPNLAPYCARVGIELSTARRA